MSAKAKSISRERDSKQDNTPLMMRHAITAPATTATKPHPHSANPAAAPAILNTTPMLIGEVFLPSFQFLFFSVPFMLSDFFLTAMPTGVGVLTEVSGCGIRSPQSPKCRLPAKNTLAPQAKEEDFLASSLTDGIR